MLPSRRELYAYWNLARPAGVWAPSLLPLLGYGWAHWDRALLAWRAGAVPLLLLCWLLLNIGTLWLNAARDRDQGEVIFGRPTALPRYLPFAGYATLALALGLSLILESPAVSITLLACVALAILYSHPATAWKSHPILGPLTNVVGYGLLSPAAGYLLVGTPLTPRTLAITVVMALIALASTLAAQAFQREEDQRRGDRTFVVTHGPALTLRSARLCLGGVGILLFTLILMGWLPLVLLAALIGLWWLDRYLVAWAALPDGGTAGHAKGFMLRGLAVGAGVLALAFADYLDDSYHDRPVAGLSTAAGHPRDRTPEPHTILRLRDAIDRTQHHRPYPPG